MKRPWQIIGWLLVLLSILSILGHFLFPEPHRTLDVFFRESPVRVALYLLCYDFLAAIAVVIGVMNWRVHHDIRSKFLTWVAATVFFAVAITRLFCRLIH